MKGYFRISLSIFLLGVLLVISAVRETRAQGIVNEILSRMDTHYKVLSSLRSNIEVDQLRSQPGQTRQLQGKLIFLPKTSKREMHTRIDWKLPRVEHMAVIGDSFTLYRPGLEMVIKDKIDNAESVSFAASALSFGRISKVQMKATYTIEYFGQEEITGKGTNLAS